MTNPDVNISPESRGHPPFEKSSQLAEQGEKYRDGVIHHYRHEEQGALSMTEVFKPSWWKQRMEVHADPKAHTLGGKVTVA